MPGGQVFDGPRFSGFLLDPEAVMIVGIDVPRDIEGEEHYLYDERVNLPLREEFVRNVMVLGVKKAVLVTKIGDRPFVVDGRQRVRAAREANKRLVARGEAPIRIPVVQQKGEEALLMTIGISTNEFNVEDTPLTKARKAQRLRDRGLSTVEIAGAFGVTTQAILNWEQLLGLSAPVQKAVEAGEVSASAAVQLRDLPAVEQRKQLAGLTSGGKRPTARETKAAARGVQGKSTMASPSKRVLRRIVEQAPSSLASDFIEGVAFAIGLRSATSIDGLSEVLESMAKKS